MSSAAADFEDLFGDDGDEAGEGALVQQGGGGGGGGGGSGGIQRLCCRWIGTSGRGGRPSSLAGGRGLIVISRCHCCLRALATCSGGGLLAHRERCECGFA